ncbi:MAG: hypothetical protein SV775_17815 [Thermodesulfobacteriota bacterium]|nr:hypothetical protein [Thermodesulfobacteriota bacterium]
MTSGGLWSGATDFGDGWKYLEWFGSFWVDDASSWIYHTQHGWVSAYGDSTSSIWLYTSEIGWFWTSDSVYPWIYIANWDVWDIWG